MMDNDTILESLCHNDPRNPMYEDIWIDYDKEEIPKPRQDNCYCDNCFYGKDKLAMEILRLREENDNIRKEKYSE